MSHTINIADATLMGEILMLRLKSNPDMEKRRTLRTKSNQAPASCLQVFLARYGKSAA